MFWKYHREIIIKQWIYQKKSTVKQILFKDRSLNMYKEKSYRKDLWKHFYFALYIWLSITLHKS